MKLRVHTEFAVGSRDPYKWQVYACKTSTELHCGARTIYALDQDRWPKVIADNNTWKELLEMEENWDKNIPSVLMFYLVEMTYWNADLWNTLFKPISDHPLTLSHRIIIFTGCPNPTRIDALPVAPVTNMHIKPSQMVSLAPIDHHDGLGAA